jgi:CDP-diacylglycerol--glycerol-3-phosphate 3-phosphatidyltransferase
MIYRWKARFQTAVRGLAGNWMTPDMALFSGGLATLAGGACLYAGLVFPTVRWLLLLVPPLLLLRMALNALDGMLARERGQATALGEVLNEGVDVVGDTLAYGVLYFVPEGPRLTVAVFLLCTWAAEFFGVLGKGLPGGARRYEAAFGGKPDRAFWMAVLALALWADPRLLAYAPHYLAAVSVLIGLTALLRACAGVREARGRAYDARTPIGR